MILIVGSEGAQGKRYQAILRHLGRRFVGVDAKTSLTWSIPPERLDGIIVATPTETHFRVINGFTSLRVPILVEKPISSNIVEVRELAKWTLSGLDLSMVCQYRQLFPAHAVGDSFYNYFRHGNDGLVWDCLQIIGLAKGQVQIDETSPIWNCQMNGQKLNLSDMDRAYVLEVEQWLTKERRMAMGELLEIHQKVHEYAETHK